MTDSGARGTRQAGEESVVHLAEQAEELLRQEQPLLIVPGGVPPGGSGLGLT